MKIVAFTGRKGSGKDTAAEALRNIGYEVMSFADTMKDGLSEMLLIDRIYFDDPDLKERLIDDYDVTPRYLMQTIGTDWGRKMISENLWIKVMNKRLNNCKNNYITVTDVRFNSEARLIKDLGGKIINIKRNDSVYEDNIGFNHDSEKGIDEIYFDSEIVNNCSIRSFHDLVLMNS